MTTATLVPTASGLAPTPFAADGLRALERTLQTLLSPLEYPDWLSWRDAAHERLLALTGADGLGIYAPLADGMAAWYGPHVAPDVLRFYAETRAAFYAGRPDSKEEPFLSRFEALGLGVAHLAHVIDRSTFERTPLYGEMVLPNALHSLTTAKFGFGGRDDAQLYFTNERRGPHEPDDVRVALVRTVLPAFRAGLAAWHRLGAQRAELARLLDALSDATLLFGTSGELLHANPAAARLTSGTAGERVGAEAQRVAWSIGALVRRRAPAAASAALAARPDAPSALRAASAATRELRVGTTVYRLRGTLTAEGTFGRDPGVLVTVEASLPTPLTDDEIRERFGLTPREIAVARLVAEGLSNPEIGDRLGVSYFTARNHVEKVLGRLGVTSRGRVGAVLRREA